MAADPEQKDRFSALKTVLAIAGVILAVVYWSTHPGEWWKILLKAIFSPLISN
jgi:hypothetical protein